MRDDIFWIIAGLGVLYLLSKSQASTAPGGVPAGVTTVYPLNFTGPLPQGGVYGNVSTPTPASAYYATASIPATENYGTAPGSTDFTGNPGVDVSSLPSDQQVFQSIGECPDGSC